MAEEELTELLDEVEELAGIGSWAAATADSPQRSSKVTDGIFGIRPGDVQSPEDFFRFVHPDDLAVIHRATAALRPDAPTEYEFRIVRPGGEIRIVRARGKIRLRAGREPQIIGVVEDVTDLRRADAARSRSEARYRAIFDGSPTPKWLFDPKDGRFLEVNAAAIRHYGWTREEFLAMSIFDIRPPEAREDARARIASVAIGDLPVNLGVARHMKKDGTVILVEVTGRTIELDGGRAVLIHAADVTDRIALEEQLRHAQKMEAVGRLAGGVAHDFNNILAVVMAAVTFAAESVGSAHEIAADLEDIRNGAERAANLTRQLLAFSRQQVLTPKVLDVNAGVHDLQKLLRRVIGEDVTLSTDLGERLGAVECDPGQLEQVVMNLVINARDAMPAGGHVRIATANATLDTAGAARLGLPAGRYVTLSVADDGCGMSSETLSRIFEPFFTTKPIGQGTGLGLAMVFGIVKQSGGAIDVTSAVGHGATFTVFLPRIDAPAAAVVARAQSKPSPGDETILVVEDDTAVRSVLTRVLRSAGYVVLEATDGGSAVDVVRTHAKEIDLVVTDLVMPGIGGHELAECIAELHPELPVLFMSGYTDHAALRAGNKLRSGENYLQKPFRPTELTACVRQLLSAPLPA